MSEDVQSQILKSRKEMFNGGLTGKVMDGIVDQDHKDIPCNYNIKTKKKVVVYMMFVSIGV